MIARGLRDLALVALALAGFTGLASLAVGGAAGLSAQRAVSGGFLLVGSIVFTAGALAGLRDPARASRRERLSGRGAATGRLDELGGRVPALRGARRPRHGARPGRRPSPSARLVLMTGRPLALPGRECDAARARVSLALDGALDDVGRGLLARHLATVRRVLGFAAELGALTTLLRAAPLEPHRCELERPSRRAARRLPWAGSAAVVAALALGITSLPVREQPVDTRAPR